jgi:Glycosyl hydrolase family 26
MRTATPVQTGLSALVAGAFLVAGLLLPSGGSLAADRASADRLHTHAAPYVTRKALHAPTVRGVTGGSTSRLGTAPGGAAVARKVPTRITGPGLTLPSSGGTLFGESTQPRSGTVADALARESAKFGRPNVVRYYSPGLPTSWTTLNKLTSAPLVVSFKSSPIAVARGDNDAYLRAWFAAAPRDRVTWWTYYHEPENDIEAGAFTAADFRAAFRHVAALAAEAHNSDLRATLILMGYTTVSRTRTWTDYYPGADVVDVLGWDVYNHNAAQGIAYSPPATVFGKVVAASNAAGKPFGIAETGAIRLPTDTGAGRGAYLRAAADYLRGAGAEFVTYFDSTHGGNFVLDDAPSVGAWAQQMR